jgi:hypothetical protein
LVTRAFTWQINGCQTPGCTCNRSLCMCLAYSTAMRMCRSWWGVLGEGCGKAGMQYRLHSGRWITGDYASGETVHEGKFGMCHGLHGLGPTPQRGACMLACSCKPSRVTTPAQGPLTWLAVRWSHAAGPHVAALLCLRGVTDKHRPHNYVHTGCQASGGDHFRFPH